MGRAPGFPSGGNTSTPGASPSGESHSGLREALAATRELAQTCDAQIAAPATNALLRTELPSANPEIRRTHPLTRPNGRALLARMIASLPPEEAALARDHGRFRRTRTRTARALRRSSRKLRGS
jgi:hypothetical protein